MQSFLKTQYSKAKQVCNSTGSREEILMCIQAFLNYINIMNAKRATTRRTAT